jgi:hypothetical protein
MSEAQSVESIDRSPLTSRVAASHPRAIGSPLPMGAGRRLPVNPDASEGNRLTAGPPGRALPGPSSEESAGIQKAINVFRAVIPIVQRVLPLLDGNFANAVGNLLAPRPHPPAPPAPKVDLVPLEEGLAALHAQHRNLRDQVAEQDATLKRVEDRLEMVREATDRNTLEQQELLEDLKLFGNKVKMVAFVGIGLIVVGIFLNLILFLRMKSLFP